MRIIASIVGAFLIHGCAGPQTQGNARIELGSAPGGIGPPAPDLVVDVDCESYGGRCKKVVVIAPPTPASGRLVSLCKVDSLAVEGPTQDAESWWFTYGAVDSLHVVVCAEAGAPYWLPHNVIRAKWLFYWLKDTDDPKRAEQLGCTNQRYGRIGRIVMGC